MTSTSIAISRTRCNSCPLVEDGLVEIDSTRIIATSRGRLLLRIIAMCFDRYLNQAPDPAVARPRYSRVI